VTENTTLATGAGFALHSAICINSIDGVSSGLHDAVIAEHLALAAEGRPIMLVVKIRNTGSGAWEVTTRDGAVNHDEGPGSFPPEAIAATPNEGDETYYEAVLDVEFGRLDFSAPSTLDAYEAGD